MIHVADSPVNRLFDRFFGAFYPYPANKSALRCGRDHPRSGIRETWLAPNVHLATILPPHATRSTPDQRRSGRAQTLPRWLLPDTDTRVGKDRTRPDLHERPVFIQYVTEPGDSFGQIKHLPEFAQAVRHGVPELSDRGVNSQ